MEPNLLLFLFKHKEVFIISVLWFGKTSLFKTYFSNFSQGAVDPDI